VKINKIYPEIYEIENFIDDNEQKQVLDLINSINEKDWFKNDSGYETDFWAGKTISISNEIIKIIDNKVRNLFEPSGQVTSINGFSRYKNDENIGEHYDYWKLDSEEIVKYGIVLYYNDDYNGGEVSYPELDIKIKPKAKSLLIHGGRILHGTLPVKGNGIRYFSTCFVKETKKSPIKFTNEIERLINE
jgi:hypothetical protein